MRNYYRYVYCIPSIWKHFCALENFYCDEVVNLFPLLINKTHILVSLISYSYIIIRTQYIVMYHHKPKRISTVNIIMYNNRISVDSFILLQSTVFHRCRIIVQHMDYIMCKSLPCPGASLNNCGLRVTFITNEIIVI